MQLPFPLTGNGGAENACRCKIKSSNVDMLVHVDSPKAGMQGDMSCSVSHFKAIANICYSHGMEVFSPTGSCLQLIIIHYVH